MTPIDTPKDETPEDSRQTQVLKRIDACLKQQQETNRKLSLQVEQMAEQRAQIDQLNNQLMDRGLIVEEDSGSAPRETMRCTPSENGDEKLLVGSMEKIWLPDLGLALPARVDTGAETASLDARNIEVFERNSRRWVRFEIMHPTTAEPILLERKLKRTVLIYQSNTAEPERRRVVKLSATVGNVNQTAEFTLSNRSHLDHQALIGRNILQDVMVVDVSKKYIAPPVTKPDDGEQ